MDKRYVELIAQNMKFKLPKWMSFLIIVALVIGGLGFVALYKQLVLGYYFSVLGIIIFIGDYFFITRYRIKMGRKFVADFEKTGKLPDWPEARNV